MKKNIIILIILYPFLVSSQDSLSLSDAIQIGLKQNFDVQLTKKNVEINEIFNNWGEAGRYPSINIGFGQDNRTSDQRNNPTSFIQEILKSNSFNGNVGLNWTIFNGFSVRANKIRLEQLLDQSQVSATLALENVIHGIILTYYQSKLQRDQLTLLKNVLDLSREKFEYQNTKNELGLGNTVDLLQYENSYLSDSSNLLIQELAYKNSIRNLNILMGVEIEKSWSLITKLSPVNNLYSYDDLKQKMLSNNTNISNQYLNISLLKQDINIAKAAFYPVVSFSSGANIDNSYYKISSYDGVRGVNLNYYGNFTLNFKIFDGGKVRRGIKALKIQEQVNELETEQLKLELAQELSTVFDTYQTRLRIFDINKKAFQVARKGEQSEGGSPLSLETVPVACCRDSGGAGRGSDDLGPARRAPGPVQGATV